jgi:hypothetical protein
LPPTGEHKEAHLITIFMGEEDQDSPIAPEAPDAAGEATLQNLLAAKEAELAQALQIKEVLLQRMNEAGQRLGNLETECAALREENARLTEQVAELEQQVATSQVAAEPVVKEAVPEEESAPLEISEPPASPAISAEEDLPPPLEVEETPATVSIQQTNIIELKVKLASINNLLSNFEMKDLMGEALTDEEIQQKEQALQEKSDLERQIATGGAPPSKIPPKKVAFAPTQPMVFEEAEVSTEWSENLSTLAETQPEKPPQVDLMELKVKLGSINNLLSNFEMKDLMGEALTDEEIQQKEQALQEKSDLERQIAEI